MSANKLTVPLVPLCYKIRHYSLVFKKIMRNAMERPSERFDEYVSLMTQSLGHADRVEPFRGYCAGLMLPVRRKSVEPMAAHLSPDRVRSEHQRLHHFVADAPWSDQAVLDNRLRVLLERKRDVKKRCSVGAQERFEGCEKGDSYAILPMACQ